jgi:hypothetical protein
LERGRIPRSPLQFHQTILAAEENRWQLAASVAEQAAGLLIAPGALLLSRRRT